MEGAPESYPSDKILCQGRFVRYVVACMKNCPEPGHCPEFWEFFRVRGITPVQYSNRNGIGEDVMKRIVFDCDRCGKRDIGEPFSPFRTSGDGEGSPLEAPEFREVFDKVGPLGCSEVFLQGVLGLLHQEHDWEHYCEPCFRKVAQASGAIVGRTPARAPAAQSAMSPLAQALSGSKRPSVLPLKRIDEDVEDSGGDDEADEAPVRKAPRKSARPRA
jgi:hypothetical protein